MNKAKVTKENIPADPAEVNSAHLLTNSTLQL